MPKFQVELIKETWEKTFVEIEAADETAAGARALAWIETDETGRMAI